MTIQVAMYCWYGNEVMLTSANIRDAAYNLGWCDCGPKVSSYLFIIMERSKRPAMLTAGKYAQLSLRALAQVRKLNFHVNSK